MNILKKLNNYNNNSAKLLTKTTTSHVNNFQIVKFVENSTKDGTIVAPINFEKIVSIYNNQDINIKNLILDNNGHIYFTGYINKTIILNNKTYKISNNNYSDVIIGRINKYLLNIDMFIQVPGIGTDKGLSITIDNKNNIYICGTFDHSITFGSIYLYSVDKSKNFFISKYNTTTNEWIWTKTAGGLSSCKYIKYINNKIYICGYFINKIVFSDMIPKTTITSNNKNIFVGILNINDGDWEYIKYKPYEVKITNFDIINNNMILNMINNNIIIQDIIVDNTWQTKFEYVFENIDNIDLYKENIYIKNRNSICKNNNILIQINGIIYDYCFDKQYNIIFIGYCDNKISINNKTLYGKSNFICKINNDGTCIYLLKLDININDNKLFIQRLNNIYILYTNNIIYQYIEDDRYEKKLSIVKNSSLSSNNVDIEYIGNIKYGFDNLKPGYEYYIQNDGLLDIISNDFYLGTALSNDQLLI